MKRTTLFIMMILMLTGTAGCSRTANLHTAESVPGETTLKSANEILPERDKDEEEESLEESIESDISVASETVAESSTKETNSKPTTPSAVDKTPPPTAGTLPQPPASSSQPPRESPIPAAPVYTQKDFDEIIAAVREYAESQTDIKFAWKPTMRKDDGASGYHDTPNLSRDGKERLIRELKYSVDLTVQLLMDQTKGIISCTVDYNILWYEQDRYFFQEPGKDIFFVLLYG